MGTYPLRQREVGPLSIMCNSSLDLHMYFQKSAKKTPQGEWVPYPLWDLWYAPHQLWWSSVWGQISVQVFLLRAAELALWLHVRFIKFAFSTGLGFQNILAWALQAFKNFSREMLSTDCSALDILPTAVKSGTVFYYSSGMGFGVLFYYILLFFFLQGFGGEGIWTNTSFSLGHHYFLPTSTFGLFLSFLTSFATLAHVFCAPRAGLCSAWEWAWL